jgi:hypothetical protein
MPGGGAAGGVLPTAPEAVVVTVPDGGGVVEVSVGVDAAILSARTSGGR